MAICTAGAKSGGCVTLRHTTLTLGGVGFVVDSHEETMQVTSLSLCLAL